MNADNPLYASYVIHLVAQAAAAENEFTRIALFDELLDAIDATPAIYGCLLADAVLPVEAYLSLRPERYEQIAQYARETRLEFGPWWVDVPTHSLETTIRNLKLGVDTLRLLEAPVTVAPLWPGFHPQMPQILRGFGIEAAVMERTPSGRAAEVVAGLDGSTVSVFQAPAIEDAVWERATAQTSGRHLMVRVQGQPARWLQSLDTLNDGPDDVFLSSRGAMVSAATAHPPEDVTQLDGETVDGCGLSSAERFLLHTLEPATVWAAYEGSSPIKNPQRILQSLWRDLLRVGEGFDEARAHRLLELYAEAGEMFSVEGEGFRICAVKLRDDGQPGVILRGFNPTGDAQSVQVRAWREFQNCAVVRLDETRTGAGLPIQNGTVQFTSNPHRITTLWLFD